MSPLRKLAGQLLRLTVRYVPEDSRDWAEAMLGELNFVQGDWAALFWAVGGISAIFGQFLRGWAASASRKLADLFGLKSTVEGNKMNSTGRKTLGVLLGMGIALALGVGAYFLRHAIGGMLLAAGIPLTKWSHLFSMVVPTEMIVVVAAIVLWRKHRVPVAVGLLITGAVMAAHIVVSFVM